MTRIELFKVLCDRGLRYPRPGKIWMAPFPSWFKDDWLYIYHQNILGCFSAALKTSPSMSYSMRDSIPPGITKENRRDVDVGPKDSQKKSHDVYRA
ncbi:uncharacterized protein G2W53_037312 [Senna tora]|uniref:Uncharacterized protein n=1 Tax=Senna tora TaxID=362788 RepID=A0A834T681_9FABA|nr:uncharacterized protein G2W53_037312 [Senna tora]